MHEEALPRTEISASDTVATATQVCTYTFTHEAAVRTRHICTEISTRAPCKGRLCHLLRVNYDDLEEQMHVIGRSSSALSPHEPNTGRVAHTRNAPFLYGRATPSDVDRCDVSDNTRPAQLQAGGALRPCAAISSLPAEYAGTVTWRRVRELFVDETRRDAGGGKTARLAGLPERR